MAVNIDTQRVKEWEQMGFKILQGFNLDNDIKKDLINYAISYVLSREIEDDTQFNRYFKTKIYWLALSQYHKTCRQYKALENYRLINTPINKPEKDILSIELTSCMEALPTEYKQILSNYYFKGYTEKEIADMNNVSQATISSKIKHALQNLKEIYDKNK